MCAVGINPRLEPHPGIADFLVWESLGDLMSHRLNTYQGNLVLGDTFPNCRADRFAADIADTGAVFDDFDFFCGFDHALTHGGLGNIEQLSSWERILDSLALHGGQSIVFNTNALGDNALTAQRFLKAKVEVVATPVGINNVVTIAGAPWHTGVNICSDRDGFLLGHDQGI